MKAVTAVESTQTKRVVVDYAKLADLYNSSVIGGGVELENISNITLFRKRLEARGITSGTDFEAFTKDGKTVVKRLSETKMSRG